MTTPSQPSTPESATATTDIVIMNYSIGGGDLDQDAENDMANAAYAIGSALLDWYTIELFVGILLRYHLHALYRTKCQTLCEVMLSGG